MGVLSEELEISFNDIKVSSFPYPPWQQGHIRCCYALLDFSKHDNPDHIVRQCFLDHNHQAHANSNAIFTDGSKSNGEVGCAAVCAGVIQRRLPGRSTVFTSELMAILISLEALSRYRNQSYVIFTDSLSSMKAMESCGSQHPLVSQIHQSLIGLCNRRVFVCFCWVPSHVGIPGNEEADRAAKAATHLPDISPVIVPPRELYPLIQTALREVWQGTFNLEITNKLHEIKPAIEDWPSCYSNDRKKETLLCRLRIGHTWLTNGYLLRGEPQPVCDHCRQTLTVKHILLDCQQYMNIRIRIFGHQPNILLDHIIGKQCSIDKVYQFIREIGLQGKL
jgi:kelch-like protein 2/3